MIPSSHCTSGWDGLSRTGYLDEFDPLEELLSEETFADNSNKRQGGPGDLLELAQISAAPSPDWETHRISPELFGNTQQDMGDAGVSYYEYEVIRSEVTHLISVGEEEEYRVIQTVHRRTVRWQEATTECDCCFDNGEALSRTDTSTATCGFLGRQQAFLDGALGGSGHHLAEGPVGDTPDARDGEFGDSNFNCSNLKTCCGASGGCRDPGHRTSLEPTEGDPQFLGDLLQTLRENSRSFEANCGSAAIDQRIIDNFRNTELL